MTSTEPVRLDGPKYLQPFGAFTTRRPRSSSTRVCSTAAASSLACGRLGLTSTTVSERSLATRRRFPTPISTRTSIGCGVSNVGI